MAIEVRTARDDEREALHRLSQRAFLARSSPYDEDQDRVGIPLDRRLVAVDGGRVVGKLAVWELGQWFGGRRVPMGGVAGVAVEPTARGKGVGSALLRAMLPAMRERGEVIASLYPMNHTFYRKHGWEVAGAYPEQRVDMRAFVDLPKPGGAVTVRAATEADLPAIRKVVDEASRFEAGNLSYSESFASLRLLGRSDTQRETYVAESGGEVTGVLTFEHTDPTSEHERYGIAIQCLAATDLDTELEFARILAVHYPVVHSAAFVAPSGRTLPMLLGERSVRPCGSGWCWMTRLVDAAGAIAARGYAEQVDVEVDLEIDDPVAPWNAGRFILRVRDGQGTLAPGGSGRVRVGIGRLASLYTGWASPRHLARLGLLQGATDADLAALEHAFAGPAPWCRDFF